MRLWLGPQTHLPLRVKNYSQIWTEGNWRGENHSFLFQNIAFFPAMEEPVSSRERCVGGEKKNFIWTIEPESNLIEWLTVKWVYFVTPGCCLWVNAEKLEWFRCVFIDCGMWMQQRGCNLSTCRSFLSPLPHAMLQDIVFSPAYVIYYLCAIFTCKHDKETNLLWLCCWSDVSS